MRESNLATSKSAAQKGEASHRVAIYPGTFDPVTMGHIDIATRALHLCDKLIIAVGDNRNKSPLFSVEQRMSLIRESLEQESVNGRIVVEAYHGLTVGFAQQKGATMIVRGLRAVTDFEWEFQLALINRKQDPQIETVCLMTSQEYSFLSASMVRELAMLGGKLDEVVPPPVANALRSKFDGKGRNADVRDV